MAIVSSLSEGIGLIDRIINLFKTTGIYYGVVVKQKNDTEDSISIEIINRERSVITNLIIEITSNAKIIGDPDFKKDKPFLKKEYSEDKFLLVIANRLNPRQVVSLSFDCEKNLELTYNDIDVNITCCEEKQILSMNKMVREKDEIPLMIDPISVAQNSKISYNEVRRNILR